MRRIMRTGEGRYCIADHETEEIRIWTAQASTVFITEEGRHLDIRLQGGADPALPAKPVHPGDVSIHFGGKEYVLADLLADAQRARDLEESLDSLAAMHGTG